MDKKQLTKNLISLLTRLQNVCEGFDVDYKNSVISSRVKILFEISKAGSISPSVLKNKVALAKSNLALNCKVLLNQGKITKKVDELDSRIIFYSLTESGKQELEETLLQIEKNYTTVLAYKNRFREMDELVKLMLEIVEE